MALDQGAALDEVREKCATVTGIVAAFSESASAKATTLPPSLGVFPCLLVMSGPTRSYDVMVKRHTYEVRIWVLVQQAGFEAAGARAMPFTTRIIETFHDNVVLGGHANWAVFERASGLMAFEWNGIDYLGHEVTLLVSEQDSTDMPAAGTD